MLLEKKRWMNMKNREEDKQRQATEMEKHSFWRGERNQGKKEENREGRQKEDRTRRDEFRQ